jgi:hypothetical protein
MENGHTNYCRVCGLHYVDTPWEDGIYPSFDICVCCGVEFGNEDVSIHSIREYRNNWIKKGAIWNSEIHKPANWNLEGQLKNIPDKFR